MSDYLDLHLATVQISLMATTVIFFFTAVYAVDRRNKTAKALMRSRVRLRKKRALIRSMAQRIKAQHEILTKISEKREPFNGF